MGSISTDTLPSTGNTARQILRDSILNNDGLQIPAEVAHKLDVTTFTPKDALPILPTPLRMAETAAALWATIGLFSACISEKRYDLPAQRITVNVENITLFPMSAMLFELDGKSIWDPTVLERASYMDLGGILEPYRGFATNIYPTKDGKWFQLHGSLNTDSTLDMLGLPHHRPDLSSNNFEDIVKIYKEAVLQHDSEWLQSEANGFWRQAGCVCYTKEEYRQTAHGKASRNESLYKVNAIDSHIPAVPWPLVSDKSHRPLSGIKILDFTRVIAGPTISKILALAGADLLRISTKTLPDAFTLLFDTQIGKRDADLNLKTTEGKLALRRLVEDADVIVDGFRPGALEKLGLGREWMFEMASRRGKGLIYARENTYGWVGEWKDRSGWQQISDCSTGVSWEQGKFLGLDEPVLPLLPNSDYQTGIVGAIGVMQALYSRSLNGGSYTVDLSLNAWSCWALDIGLQPPEVCDYLRSIHPDFLPRHTTGIFPLVEMTKKAVKKATGNKPGNLFDPKRFTTGNIRWGQENETGRYLDWRQFVTFETQSDTDGKGGSLELDYNTGSCLPGSDKAEWW